MGSPLKTRDYCLFPAFPKRSPAKRKAPKRLIPVAPTTLIFPGWPTFPFGVIATADLTNNSGKHMRTSAFSTPATQQASRDIYEEPLVPAAAQPLYPLVAQQVFFAQMDPRYLQLLAASATRTEFYPGQTIFRSGDPANRFYIILKGRIAVESRDQNGAVHQVQMLGPHDPLGWSWLFPPYYWHFDAVAIEPTEALFFYGTRLRAECEKDHHFGFELMRRMSEVAIARLQATRRNWIKESNSKTTACASPF